MFGEMPDVRHTSHTFYIHTKGFWAMRLQDPETVEVIVVLPVFDDKATTRQVVKRLERKYRQFLRWLSEGRLEDAPYRVIWSSNEKRVTVYV